MAFRQSHPDGPRRLGRTASNVSTVGSNARPRGNTRDEVEKVKSKINRHSFPEFRTRDGMEEFN